MFLVKNVIYTDIKMDRYQINQYKDDRYLNRKKGEEHIDKQVYDRKITGQINRYINKDDGFQLNR